MKLLIKIPNNQEFLIMNKFSLKKEKVLKKKNLNSENSFIPFLFSVAVEPQKDSSQISSFNRELIKITKKTGPILENNLLKSPENSNTKRQSDRNYK